MINPWQSSFFENIQTKYGSAGGGRRKITGSQLPDADLGYRTIINAQSVIG
jgi:hypothetical protein